ncbi:MAG: N-acetylmuramoyl-L-alanine amidase [Pseudomonadota bacterium]
MSNVRIGVHPDKTRLVVELSGKVPYKVFTLPNPYRVVIDLPEVGWKLANSTKSSRMGVITSYRFGLFQPGNSRLVVDIERPVKLLKHVMLPATSRYPHRLVFDLQPVTPEEFARSERQFASQGWVDRAVRAAIPPPKAPIGLGSQKRLVVLDAGHGGPDPGAISVRGYYEKNLTLQVARSVKQTLESTGRYKVYLTRDKDVFVPLRRRYQLAEEAGGELFISLHADSHRDSRLRGASVYTLSENASDREAAALAAKENRSDAIAGVDLTHQSDAVASFLIELRQRQTLNESALFSEVLLKEIASETRLLRNSHRFAGFAVLKSPDVPSVLVELGYLSNRQDEKVMRTKNFRKKMGRAILRATDAYFERQERLSRS